MTPPRRGALPRPAPPGGGRPGTALVRAGEAALLEGLVRAPLVSAGDLASVAGLGGLSGVQRRLRALTGRGLVEYVVPSSSVLAPQRVYYLTNRGLHLAAALAGVPAAAFARQWGLGEGALRARLARLDHLLLTRGLLIDLLRALPRREDGALAAWQPWPVRWPYQWQGRERTLWLDGAGLVSHLREGDEGSWSALVLLWDDRELDVEALRPRLRAVLQARPAWGGLAPGAPAVPTVLLVAGSPPRARAAHALARDLARALDGAPLALLTTAQGDALSAEGPLAVLWQGGDGAERDLLASLPRVREPAPHLPGLLLSAGRPPGNGEAGRPRCVAWPPRGRVLVRGHFAARAAAVGRPRHDGAAARDRAVISLALKPRELRALRWIAVQPFLLARHAAELAGDSPRRITRTLDRLRTLELIAADLPPSAGIPARRRYVLTPLGLRLLAARAGLAPRDYLRHTGSIAGTLAALAPGAGHRAVQANPRSSQPGTATLPAGHLVWMATYRQHTLEMQDLFLQVERAARGSGGPHVLEEWRGEWACVRRFPYDGRWHTLRPDAAGRYRAGAAVLSFFVELDRGRYGGHVWRGKLESYSAYQASGTWARRDAAFPTLLVVTTGEGRLRTILALAGAVAAAALAPPLPLLVATAADLAAQGPLGPIWRAAAREPPRCLFGTGAPARGPPRGTAGEG